MDECQYKGDDIKWTILFDIAVETATGNKFVLSIDMEENFDYLDIYSIDTNLNIENIKLRNYDHENCESELKIDGVEMDEKIMATKADPKLYEYEDIVCRDVNNINDVVYDGVIKTSINSVDEEDNHMVLELSLTDNTEWLMEKPVSWSDDYKIVELSENFRNGELEGSEVYVCSSFSEDYEGTVTDMTDSIGLVYNWDDFKQDYQNTDNTDTDNTDNHKDDTTNDNHTEYKNNKDDYVCVEDNRLTLNSILTKIRKLI